MKAELRRVLAELGPARIYRPVLDRDGRVLAEGVEPMEEGLVETVRGLRLAGQRVADLGCRLGFFTFLAARFGAARVTAVDADPLALRAVRLIKELDGWPQVEVVHADLATWHPQEIFDTAMMVDLIGADAIRAGQVAERLGCLRHVRARRLVLGLKAEYKLKHLGLDGPRLAAMYGARYVAGKNFLLLQYITDLLSGAWTLRPEATAVYRPDEGRTLTQFTAR